MCFPLNYPLVHGMAQYWTQCNSDLKQCIVAMNWVSWDSE